MKIVFDTNVILSALITQGLSSRVLDICIDKHVLFISPWILDEVVDKLHIKFNIPFAEIERVKSFIKSIFIIVNPKGATPKICRDNDDNNILLLADEVSADIIITGDKDLLLLKRYHNAHVVLPRQFIEYYYKTE